jgi:hypothetical protein
VRTPPLLHWLQAVLYDDRAKGLVGGERNNKRVSVCVCVCQEVKKGLLSKEQTTTSCARRYTRQYQRVMRRGDCL